MCIIRAKQLLRENGYTDLLFARDLSRTGLHGILGSEITLISKSHHLPNERFLHLTLKLYHRHFRYKWLQLQKYTHMELL